jgi:catechol 2,3-dioxygenase-like lactoylglutathione lyase family enzyme
MIMTEETPTPSVTTTAPRVVDAATRVRIARPSRDLAAAERFYVRGLGLEVLWRSGAHVPGEHDLLMVGPPGAAWHLELTHDPEQPLEPTPTVDDLFVLYLGAPVDQALLERLKATGGTPVPAHNPYWDRYAVTVADPDGYRLVLCSRTWNP